MLATLILLFISTVRSMPNPMALWNTNEYCGTMSYEYNIYGRNEHTDAETIDLQVLSVVQGYVNFRFRCQEIES